MNTRSILTLLAALAALLVFTARPARAATPTATYIIPDFIEKEGLVTSATNTFDTVLNFTYTGGLTGVSPRAKSAQVDVYLYDETGAPLVSKTGQTVCNPCSYSFGASNPGSAMVRKQSIRLDDLITTAGGFPNPSADGFVHGFAIIVITGDVRYLHMSNFVVNSHTSAFDVSTYDLATQKK